MTSNVDKWLIDNGLEKYCDVFQKNDVDVRVLPYLTEDDLRELGLSLGHRRMFFAALAALDAGPQPTTAPAEPEPDGTAAVMPDTAPDQPPGPRDDAEYRHLSVMFVDMVGSTSLADAMHPEDMRDLLQSYQDAVTKDIAHFGGHVAKYMGDGVLGYFGWPAAYEDHADRAVRAGLRIIDSVRALPKPQEGQYAVRVGVASGPVVVGDLVGAQMREDDAMVGAVVNLAARLQSEADPDTVALSLETRKLIGQGFEIEPLGPRSLKGFDVPREIFLARGERFVESRFEARRTGRDTPLVGRDEELALLMRCWRVACGGRGQVVLLNGEAGMGKSRIAQELVDGMDASIEELLRFQCAPYHVNSAFHPITERLSRAAGLSSDNSAEENLERITALVKSQFLECDSDVPIYAALLGVGASGSFRLQSLEPQQLKLRTIETLARSIAERAARHPILMIVEDAHWIDPSSFEAFERVVEICVDLPVMLVVTHRPEWSCDWASVHPHVSVLRLGRLSRDNVGELIAGLLDRQPEDQLIVDLLDRTDGVPLFVEELARAIGENPDGGTEGAVPDSLQGVLLSRLERVSRKARRVSLVASVIGREFEREILTEVAELPPDEIDPALEELRRANIIFESGLSKGSFAFRHALIQETAYRALLRRNRRSIHGSVARAIEYLRPGQVEREPEVVARHFTEAGEAGAALAKWTAAANRALGRSATYEAVSHAREALSSAKSIAQGPGPAAPVAKARILVSEACREAGNLPLALKQSWKAAEEAKALDDPALFADAAMAYMDNVMLAGKDSSPALKLCTEALEDARNDDIHLQCRLRAHLARGHMMNGDLAESTQYGRDVESLAQQLGDTRALFSQLMSRFLAPVIVRDEVERANWRERIQKLLDLGEESDDSDRGRASAIATFVGAEMGDRHLMEEALQRLENVGAARQHMHMDWICLHGRAMKAILDGRFAEAEKLAQEALELGTKTHGSHVEGLYGVQMFTIRREQARLMGVAPVIKRLLDENSGDASWKPGFALVAAELGHTDAAARMMGELAADGFNLPLDAKYSATLGYLADTAVMIGDSDMAETLYQRLLPYRGMTVTMGVATVCYGSADRRLGSLAALNGDWTAMEDHFDAALQIDEAMNALPWLARSKAEFASAMMRRGRTSDMARANRFVVEAMETAKEIGMIALENELRKTMH